VTKTIFARTLLTAVIAFTGSLCSQAYAGPAEVLAAGQEKAANGDLAAALPLLTSAAEGLPQSVPAQLALAQCHLQLGQLEEALAGYRRVVRLSPDHREAKQLVAALTGRDDPEQQQALARRLIEHGRSEIAVSVLRESLGKPQSDASREAAELLLAEAELWTGDTTRAILSAVEVSTRTTEPKTKAVADVIAALAMALGHQTGEIQLKLPAAEALPPEWRLRSALAGTLVKLNDPEFAATASKQLREQIATIPSGKYRRQVQTNAQRLFNPAQLAASEGSLAKSMAIVWPMISSGPIPTVDVIGKPLKLTGGWLITTEASADSLNAMDQQLRSIASALHQTNRDGEDFVPLWLAAEMWRQQRSTPQKANSRIALASAMVAHRSEPIQTTRTSISRADELEFRLLAGVASTSSRVEERQKAVDQLLIQLSRHQQAGLLELSVLRLLDTDEIDADEIQVKLASPFNSMVDDNAKAKLQLQLANHLNQVGRDQLAQGGPQAALKTAHQYHNAAIQLLVNLRNGSQHAAATTAAEVIVDGYLVRDEFEVALSLAQEYAADAPRNTQRLLPVKLQIQHTLASDREAVALQQRLPEKITPELQAAITALVKSIPQTTVMTTPEQIYAEEQISRLYNHFLSFERNDLARQVIAAAAPEGSPLVDWAKSAEISILQQEALAGLNATAVEHDGLKRIKLQPEHTRALELLGELLTQHSKSDDAQGAVQHVVGIAAVYERYQAFDVAVKILTDFSDAHKALGVAPQLQYQALQVLTRKAHQAFAKRENPAMPPKEVSAEFEAVITAITQYLKTYPDSDSAGTVREAYFAIVNHYGQAGGWSLARTLLSRWEEAQPNQREPERLELLIAYTYLGELDPEYAMQLFRSRRDHSGDQQSEGEQSESGESPPPPGDPSQFAQQPRPNSSLNLADDNNGAAFNAPGFGPGGGFGNGNTGFGGALTPGSNAPADQLALAQIRQSQQRQSTQLAMLERNEQVQVDLPNQQPANQQTIQLPAGPVLSDAELTRQDAVAEKAYETLISLVKQKEALSVATAAKNQLFWLFGFFEGQQRHLHAAEMMEQYLVDLPLAPEQKSLSFRAVNDRLQWAQRPSNLERVDLAFLDTRHQLFEEGRAKYKALLDNHPDDKRWRGKILLAMANSYQLEAAIAKRVSVVRAGGLLAESASQLVTLHRAQPDYNAPGTLPRSLSRLAEQLVNLGQMDRAIDVHRQIPIHFPLDPTANNSVLRIAQLNGQDLAHPLRAVETYQEYLSLTGAEESVRTQVYGIAQGLANAQRYIEALHVYGVFVDSFPDDARACVALQAIANIHQKNEVWEEAIATYERVIDEYPNCEVVAAVKLSMAVCHINMSEWSEARRIYENFPTWYPEHAQIAMANTRVPVLKQLSRYQNLLADDSVNRNKDDAQLQIGRIVLSQLGNQVKAIEEFEKVVSDYPKSDLADDAQLEIGKALLALNRLDEAREALRQVALNYPTSPFADDALYIIGSSYQQQAANLANVTAETAWQNAYERNQAEAYKSFQRGRIEENFRQANRRADLKKGGKVQELALDEARNASRFNGLNFDNIVGNTKFAEQQAATESALQVANRQDRMNEAFREAVKLYMQVAANYPLGDKTDDSLLQIAQIYETKLKDRNAAMKTYQRVVKLFPGTPVAEDAAWKVAEFYEQEGQYTAALQSYREFIRTYPASSRVADAQFAMAETFEHLDKWVEAMDAYEVFRQKFNEHPKARLAADQINWIKAYRK